MKLTKTGKVIVAIALFGLFVLFMSFGSDEVAIELESNIQQETQS
jgi:hypothetical protein|tara:strand:+ start:50645 stop:50779 length:135 start_codon:yes stop_codon:yes gene_type:complete